MISEGASLSACSRCELEQQPRSVQPRGRGPPGFLPHAFKLQVPPCSAVSWSAYASAARALSRVPYLRAGSSSQSRHSRSEALAGSLVLRVPRRVILNRRTSEESREDFVGTAVCGRLSGFLSRFGCAILEPLAWLQRGAPTRFRRFRTVCRTLLLLRQPAKDAAKKERAKLADMPPPLCHGV